MQSYTVQGIVFHTVQSTLHSRPSPQTVTQVGYSEAQGLDVPQGLKYNSGSAEGLMCKWQVQTLNEHKCYHLDVSGLSAARFFVSNFAKQRIAFTFKD